MKDKENENLEYLESEDAEVLNLISQPYKYGLLQRLRQKNFQKG